MPMTKLILLDKCVDGAIGRLRQLIDPIYDDMGALYDAMRPFIQDMTLEAASYTRGSDYTQFVLQSKTFEPSRKLAVGNRLSYTMEAGRATINIPVTKEG